jgi:cation diffusion facilitator CzcD-associated flavoprotein CzcO
LHRLLTHSHTHTLAQRTHTHTLAHTHLHTHTHAHTHLPRAARARYAWAYNERLKEFGILVKARNFLVFQGDIESVASKSPKDLTALIEQVSGSEELKKDYEGALKDRHVCEDEQHAAFTKRKVGLYNLNSVC